MQICLGQKLMNDICWTRTKEGIGPSKAGLPLPQWDPAYILLFLLDSSPLSIDSCQASWAQLLAQRRSQERLAIGLVPKNKDLPGVSVLPASCSPPASHRISGECFPEITPAKTPNRMCQHRTFYIYTCSRIWHCKAGRNQEENRWLWRGNKQTKLLQRRAKQQSK